MTPDSEKKKLTLDDVREAGARDALHPDGIDNFTVNELRMQIQVPDAIAANPHFRPLARLQALWEMEIEPLPDGPDKEDLMTRYDNRVAELFSSEIINLPEKSEVPNPQFKPDKLLSAIAMHVRDFPFARAATQEKMYELIDQKTKELGLDILTDSSGNAL